MKKHREITIHHLAKELKISASTVSRALSGNFRISEKTRLAVEIKASEMGYRPNVLAANLRSKKSNTLGVIVPRIDRHFFAAAISGIEDYAWAKGFNVIIAQSHDQLDKEIKSVQTFYNNRVDGVIASISMQTNDDKHFRLFSDKNLPLLFFDRFCPTIECDRIVVDDFDSGYKITKYLIKSGCMRLAHIAGPELLNIYNDRKAGFLKAISDAGIALPIGYLQETGLTKEEGIEAFTRLMTLPVPPDAVFCGNDTTALSALQYCKTNEIRVPEDVALIGFSDEPFSEAVTPSISTVRQPGYQMGFQAAERIIQRIENNSTFLPFVQIVLSTELIIRNTTRPIV